MEFDDITQSIINMADTARLIRDVRLKNLNPSTSTEYNPVVETINTQPVELAPLPPIQNRKERRKQRALTRKRVI